jgi:hypothetical protein
MRDPETGKRLRVTGGIIIGRRRPMAFVEEEAAQMVSTQGDTTYSARRPYQIIGFPYKIDATTWRIRPVASRHSELVAAAWAGTIPSGGCQFFIRDEYSPSLTASGGTYYVNGKFSSPATEIVQRTWGYTDTETRNYSYNSGTGVVTQTAIMLTRISVVYEAGGVYYLSTLNAPDNGPSHTSFSFPTDFDITNPL